MSETIPSQESPNQPFHDLIREFGETIIANIQRPNGMAGYRTELLREYQQRLDELLAARDQQVNKDTL